MILGLKGLTKTDLDRHCLKELCHGVFIHISDLTKLFSH